MDDLPIIFTGVVPYTATNVLNKLIKCGFVIVNILDKASEVKAIYQRGFFILFIPRINTSGRKVTEILAPFQLQDMVREMLIEEGHVA